MSTANRNETRPNNNTLKPPPTSTQKSIFSIGDEDEEDKLLCDMAKEEEEELLLQAAQNVPEEQQVPREQESHSRRRTIPGPAGLRRRANKRDSTGFGWTNKARRVAPLSQSQDCSSSEQAASLLNSEMWKTMLKDHQQDEKDMEAYVNK